MIFRQRYFDDPDVGAALVTLAQGDAPSGWLDPLLYFFAAQNDRVLRDVVVDLLYPRQQAGFSDLPVEVVERQVREWVAAEQDDLSLGRHYRWSGRPRA